MTVDEMLRDLRSVKMRPTERTHVQALRERFQALGWVTGDDERWLRDACRRYGAQLRLLHEARERARQTNARRALGMTVDEVRERGRERSKQAMAEQNDLGF